MFLLCKKVYIPIPYLLQFFLQSTNVLVFPLKTCTGSFFHLLYNMPFSVMEGCVNIVRSFSLEKNENDSYLVS